MKRITGSTMIEVLVAFVIVITVFGTAMAVIQKTMKNHSGFAVMKSMSIADEMNHLINVENAGKFNEFKSSNLLVSISAEPYSGSNRLFVLNVTVSYPNGMLVKKFKYLKKTD